jgi:hypothetical protein
MDQTTGSIKGWVKRHKLAFIEVNQINHGYWKMDA